MTVTAAPYVFISYASVDWERVRAVVDALTTTGIRAWLDQDGIESGTSYGPAIAAAIRNSRALIVLCSDAALRSRNVRQEIAIAWKHERPLLPLLLDPITVLPEEVEYWLEGAQWIEVLDQPDDVWLPKVRLAFERLCGTGAWQVSDARDAVDDRPAMFTVPTPLSSLIGREREIGEVAALIRTTRLVTLVGTGGTGKTRLGIAVGHAVRDDFPDGVAFIDLTPIRDPALVIPAIAAALDIHESGGRAIHDSLSQMLVNKTMLIILDNGEQVVEAAPEIARLMAHCPHVHVLATSRIPLHISGEHEYVVAPLPVPDALPDPEMEPLRQNEAVALFIDRARAARSDFALTTENARAVAEICRYLDGLPLAIELAAARAKVLPPEQILSRLGRPLTFLAGGPRDLPERQQTIRNTIQWSYELLDDAEQHLFRRLSVFVGGWTLDAAEAVANHDGNLGIDVLDGLISLVDKSLVIQRELLDEEMRFGMLETIREFGLERLHIEDDPDVVRQHHALQFLYVNDKAEPRVHGAHEIEGLDRLLHEQENIRAALDWLVEQGVLDEGLRVVAGDGRFRWHH